MSQITPFHVSLQVRDISEAQRFNADLLDCPEGRSDTNWIDFDLFGH